MDSKKPDGSESEKLVFAAGSMLCLRGKRLSFAADDLKQGVFLVDAAGNEIRIGTYNRIGTGVVEAYVPSGIPAGRYEVKIITKPGMDRYAKNVALSAIELTE